MSLLRSWVPELSAVLYKYPAPTERRNNDPDESKFRWLCRAVLLCLSITESLQRTRAPQQLFQSRHALARGLFGRAGAAPMRLQTHHAAIAILLERAVLSKII